MVACCREHVARSRQTARKLAADAGFGSLREEDRACAKTRGDAQPKVNKDGEAFRAQFELFARAVGPSEDMKALQLALCLTDEALTCLLLLSPAERGDYGALVGALERRFGQFGQLGVLRSELASRQRLSGEPLRALANDIETLTRRAYSHMTPDVQSELARDQFIRAITPSELRMQTQLAHPRLALEREAVGAAAESYHVGAAPAVRAVVQVRPGREKPEWAAELTELIRAVSLQSPLILAHAGALLCAGCVVPQAGLQSGKRLVGSV
ncbi:hypothetical protein SRHO_G00236650 [Serrasalmus rhombeus]